MFDIFYICDRLNYFYDNDFCDDVILSRLLGLLSLNDLFSIIENSLSGTLELYDSLFLMICSEYQNRMYDNLVLE
jgi:hypothetical protein